MHSVGQPRSPNTFFSNLKGASDCRTAVPEPCITCWWWLLYVYWGWLFDCRRDRDNLRIGFPERIGIGACIVECVMVATVCCVVAV
jgi:hypothetical protein